MTCAIVNWMESEEQQLHESDSLWRHGDFLKLWSAQSISQIGTQVSFLAVPLIGAVTLDASAAQMGLLAAAETSPFLFFGLFAGVLADRVRRRPILIWTDFGRAALMAAIPVLWWLGALSLPLLIAVAFCVGTLNVLFEVSYQSYLPALVRRDQLVDGNSKLETSRAGAQIAGPGLAGGLIHLLGAPVAVVLDAASFLVSGLLLGRIEREEPRPERGDEPGSVAREIREGLGYIWKHPLLRPIAGCTGTANFFGGMGVALLVLFATTELGLSAGALGIIFAAGSLGFLAGALVAGRVAGVLGVGRTIIVSTIVAAGGVSAIACAGGPTAVVWGVLLAATATTGGGAAVYNITQVSLRQTITPDRMLGRMNATMRFLVWGTLPLGNLAGGLLGDTIGLRATFGVAGIGSLLATLWPLFSDIRHTVTYPDAPGEALEGAVAD